MTTHSLHIDNFSPEDVHNIAKLVFEATDDSGLNWSEQTLELQNVFVVVVMIVLETPDKPTRPNNNVSEEEMEMVHGRVVKAAQHVLNTRPKDTIWARDQDWRNA